ncbi:MAG: biotin/lipoyl-binding protein [Peptococcaceae bacterium]|nr:biotin/lipoyl-binding protein [Peptococcaceae bacterium]
MENILAPIPGTIVSVAVNAGQTVKAGQKILILEALKMQNEIFCEEAGTVKEILVKEGAKVKAGQTLVVIE